MRPPFACCQTGGCQPPGFAAISARWVSTSSDDSLPLPSVSAAEKCWYSISVSDNSSLLMPPSPFLSIAANARPLSTGDVVLAAGAAAVDAGAGSAVVVAAAASLPLERLRSLEQASLRSRLRHCRCRV